MAPGSVASGRRERLRPDASGSARDCSLLPSQDHLLLVSECVDPFALVRNHFRGEPEVELLAAPCPAAQPADADAADAGAGDASPGRAPAAAAEELSGAYAGDHAFRRESSAGPRLLLSKAVADWMLDVCGPGGGVAAGGGVSASDFSPYRDDASGKVWASLALSDALQSGTVRARARSRRAERGRRARLSCGGWPVEPGTTLRLRPPKTTLMRAVRAPRQAVLLLLRTLLARQGERLPFPEDVVRPGTAPPLRLQNWKLLAPLLEALGVPMSDDAKTLIVAGGAPLRRKGRPLHGMRAACAHAAARAQSASRLRRCWRR